MGHSKQRGIRPPSLGNYSRKQANKKRRNSNKEAAARKKTKTTNIGDSMIIIETVPIEESVVITEICDGETSAADPVFSDRGREQLANPGAVAVCDNSELPVTESEESVEQVDSNDRFVENEGMDFTNSRTSSAEDLLKDASESVDSQSIQDPNPEGLRPIDIRYFYSAIQRSYTDHCLTCDIPITDWIIVKINRIGLQTHTIFQCRRCMFQCSVSYQDMTQNLMDINDAAVAATIVAGIGFYQLEELLAGMNIICMTVNTYIKYREKLYDSFKTAADNCMKEAATEEKRLAIERGDVINGIPVTDVITDAAWSKRSYKTQYNALSGVGVIIGAHTDQVVFANSRNKHCSFCEYYERQNLPCKEHRCYKNHDRDASSSSMEADIILEGFMTSVETLGLIFGKLIGDGDSSSHKKILDHDPYAEYGVMVEKVECTNHLLRNHYNRLQDLAKKTEKEYLHNRQFKQARKVIEDRAVTLRKEVRAAAQARHFEEGDLDERIESLRQDILVLPYHVFGDHGKCESHDWTCKSDETNHVPTLIFFGLWQQIEEIVRDLSTQAQSLIHLLTNNSAERFNSLVCKMIAAKRIHFGARGSFDARIFAAILQHNTHAALVYLYESMGKIVPDILRRLYCRRLIIVQSNAASRVANADRKSERRRRTGTDKDYGKNSQKADKSPENLVKLIIDIQKGLRENANNRVDIEVETRGQSKSRRWHVLRKIMLTASKFGEVCRRRQTTPVKGLVYRMLHHQVDSAATKWGIKNEVKAREALAEDMKKCGCAEEIQECGLFIDTEYPFLGASPDGLIGDDTVAEFKCPYKARQLTPDEAIKKFPDIARIFDKGDLNKLRTTHPYYYQVQAQMHITGRQWCEFVLWTPKGIKRVTVEKDDDFWENEMRRFGPFL